MTNKKSRKDNLADSIESNQRQQNESQRQQIGSNQRQQIESNQNNQRFQMNPQDSCCSSAELPGGTKGLENPFSNQEMEEEEYSEQNLRRQSGSANDPKVLSD